MNPRRLQSETMTSMFIGPTHLRLRCAPPCSDALSPSYRSPREPPLPGCGPETLDLAQEARGSYRLAGETGGVDANRAARPGRARGAGHATALDVDRNRRARRDTATSAGDTSVDPKP